MHWKTVRHRFLFLGLACSIAGLFVVIALNVAFARSQEMDTSISRIELSRLDPGPVTTTVFLPLLVYQDNYHLAAPIWPHNHPPARHEVALFRHTFTLSQPLGDPELTIFADTRYEVWLDGAWLGRGPARFSQGLREYDTYPLDQLPPGDHLIAVLVQWSPNLRRSESTLPHLRTYLSGSLAGASPYYDASGANWKALLSDAWRSDAALVHSWNLIGSTELLDLSRLPKDWNQPGFSDGDWPAAVVQTLEGAGYPASLVAPMDIPNEASLSTDAVALTPVERRVAEAEAIYQPRSIPFLVNVPVSLTVLDAGLISPGFAFGELTHPTASPYTLTLNASISTTIDLETLSNADFQYSNLVRLDGASLNWRMAGAHRPDVSVASTLVSTGTHQLSFSQIPDEGLTFSISTANLEMGELPFQQGIHAGRRLLLADPVSTPGQVAISPTPDGISLTLDTLPGFVLLDLGRTVHGRITAQVSGPPGTILDIGWDERLLTGAQRALPYPGSLYLPWNQVDSWILDGDSRQITTLDSRAGRYLLLVAWGNAPLHIRQLRVYEERYPLTQRGLFTSSNPLLDRIWQTGVDTLYPNMNDAYTDTPWRERGQWWGDVIVEEEVNRVAFGDELLFRRGLLLMADAFAGGTAPGMAPNNNGINMLDYGMLWVQGLSAYAYTTGDTGPLEEAYPVLVNFMGYLETYQNPESGLIDLPRWNWWLTAYVDSAGFSSRYGQSTAVNALYYSTLKHAADIAATHGDDTQAVIWMQEAEAVKEQINTLLYLPDQHRYLANIYQGLPYSPTVHAQAWALSYGIVPISDIRQVSDSLLALLSSDPSQPNIGTYGMHWVLDALGKAGRVPEALQIIESYYGRMLDLGATTWWEGFNGYNNYGGSLSHGWGSSPTWFLTSYLVGAQRTGPNTWRLQPALAGVEHVNSRLPLQDGELSVEWRAGVCKNSSIRVSAPPGSRGVVVIPVPKNVSSLTLNNRIIVRGDHPRGIDIAWFEQGALITLRAGTHVIQVPSDCPAR